MVLFFVAFLFSLQLDNQILFLPDNQRFSVPVFGFTSLDLRVSFVSSLIFFLFSLALPPDSSLLPINLPL